MLNISVILIDDANLIEEHVISFYQGMFVDVAFEEWFHVDVSQVIPSLVSFKENSLLIKVDDLIEIRAVVQKWMVLVLQVLMVLQGICLITVGMWLVRMCVGQSKFSFSRVFSS